MKKKIVYISGGDAFDVNDVRAAFEEVRNTLNLDSDTILFGVPVDEPVQAADAIPEPAPVICETTVISDTITAEPDSVLATESESNAQENIIADDSDDEPVVESENAVPILSVLASKTSEPEIMDTDSEENHSELAETDAEDADITEMLNTDAPEVATEKTLEELLESMAPLREDIHNISDPLDEDKSESSNPDDVDATLENLASEFVETQDKMPKTKKSSERGKIGKLKNILPFKKMKKDDSGLMGDLFGWAGIAANDEDFSIPGFFTNAASKK